jgi:hypothetical protein
VREEHETRSESLIKKGVNVISKDGLVFIFFLILSFVFWYLNSLGKEIESGIRYPVKFVNLPREKVINNESPVRLNLFIKGPGYAILKLKMSGIRTPLEIDFSKVSYKRIPDSKAMDYFIVTSGLAKSFSVQLRSGCEIVSIKPDTLFFTLGKSAGNSSDLTKDF